MLYKLPLTFQSVLLISWRKFFAMSLRTNLVPRSHSVLRWKVRSGKGGYKVIFLWLLVKVVPFHWPWEIWVRDYIETCRFRFLVWGPTTITNFIDKQIILQKHCPQLAGLFKERQSVQNMKLRLRLTKESLQITNKWNKNRNMDED